MRMSDVGAAGLAPGGGAAGVLCEREREFRLLGALVEEAAAGGGRAALIEGPAGIGKSRLLAEARAMAMAEGFRVLTARGSELEREFPFGVIRQIFEAALADSGVGGR